jgi:hypothetical protein
MITWDEGDPELLVGENCVSDPSGTGCLVPTIVSPSTAGTTSTTFFDHHSLLRTAEGLLGLALLRHAAMAPGIRWRKPWALESCARERVEGNCGGRCDVERVDLVCHWDGNQQI